MVSREQQIKTETCPVCGETEYRVCAEQVKQKYRIVKCGSCGLIYTNPMPSDENDNSFNELYHDWDYHNIFTDNPEKALEMARSEMVGQFNYWKSKNLMITDKGNFLDIGCGAGHILAAAKEMGWAPIGLEIDRNAFRETAKMWDLDIRSTYLSEANFADNYFDWIRARYVFEHLPSPSDLLKDVFRVLEPGGILTIDVPNQNGFFSQLRVLRGKEQGQGQFYGYLDPPLHVIGYSPKTMKLLLLKNGFEVPLSFSTYPGSPVWRPGPPQKA